jgi:deoxyribonuclease V
VVLALPGLGLLEHRTFSCEAPFPYVPGLFFFREGPALIGAARLPGESPDLLLVDGHGLAHPRRAGIATHVGLLLGVPTVGVADRPLAGRAAEPGPGRGSAAPVLDGGEVTGLAVRTRAGARPVLVSPGYATDLETSLGVVLATTAGYRLPEPLRVAHRISREARAEYLATHTMPDRSLERTEGTP